MKGKHHLILYFLLLIPFFVYIGFYVENFYLYIPFAIISFSMVDPDEDQKIGIKAHRWFLTHSVIFPSIIWICLFIIPDVNIPFQVMQVIFFPTLVHLLGDLKKKYQGSAQISLFPFRKRLNNISTHIWMIINILACVGIIFLL